MTRNTPSLRFVADGYVGEYLPAVRKARPNTISIARSTLLGRRGLVEHTGPIQLGQLTPAIMEGYFASRSTDLAGSSLNVQRNALNVFFTYCRARQLVPHSFDPLVTIHAFKTTKTHRLRIPPQEFPRLLDVAAEFHPRDRAVVAAGLFTMLRASELAYLRVGDLDLASGRLKTTLLKNRKLDELPLDPYFEREVRAWLTVYTERHGAPARDWYLFPALAHGGWPVWDEATRRFVRPTRGMPLNPHRPLDHMEEVVQRVLRALGYPTFRQGVHTLRRSAARAMLDAQGDIRVVQAMLNHETQATTEVYVGVDRDRDQRDELIASGGMFGDVFSPVRTMPAALSASAS